MNFVKYIYTFHIFLQFSIVDVVNASVIPDEKVRVPEALTPEEYEKTLKLDKNRSYIGNELKEQFHKVEKLRDSIKDYVGSGGNGKQGPDKGINASGKLVYQESTIDLMEAPVILLELPLILPNKEIEVDEEITNTLISTGLERVAKPVKNMLSDPYKITLLEDANNAIKVTNSHIEKLRKDRKSLFDRMRQSSLKITIEGSAISEYKTLKQELLEKDNELKDEIARLMQLKHVKAALIKKHGAGVDAKEIEEGLEDRESELVGAESGDEDREARGGEESESNEEEYENKGYGD